MIDRLRGEVVTRHSQNRSLVNFCQGASDSSAELMAIGFFTPLTDLESDALGEIANIAMARAANSLHQMVGHQILLSVPYVDLLSYDAATQIVKTSDNPNLVAVCQEFTGTFSGRALLMFPEANSFELYERCSGVTPP